MRTRAQSKTTMRKLGILAAGLGLATVIGTGIAAPAFADPVSPGQKVHRQDDCPLPILCPPPSNPPTTGPTGEPTNPPTNPPTTGPTNPPPTQINQPPPGKPPVLNQNGNGDQVNNQQNSLPVTGSETALVAGTGAAVLGAGAALVLFTRRRRAAAVTRPDRTNS